MLFKSVVCFIFVITYPTTKAQLPFRPKVGYPCGVFESINIENGSAYSNGSISHNGVTYPKALHFLYVPHEESDQYLYNEELRINHRRGCICALKPCIRKCCPPGQRYVERTCTNTDASFRLTVNDLSGAIVKEAFDKFGVVQGNPCAKGFRFLLNPEDEPEEFYRLLPNGSLHLPFAKQDHIIPIAMYCIDNLLMSPEDATSGPRDHQKTEIVALLCLTELEHVFSTKPIYILYSSCMIISVFFLIATFVIYVVLPELQTLHGKSLMCCVGGLIVGYSSLSAVQLSTHLGNVACQSLGFTVYYSHMFTFFWLNVLSFDIWWSFSGHRFCVRGRRLTEARKFFFYSLYAWIGCSVLFLITLVMHLHPDVHPDNKPGIGINRCFLQDSTIFHYFYGPLSVLLLCNIFFFIATTIKLFSSNQTMTLEDRQRFFLVLKFFCIMGVTWVFEIISHLVGGHFLIWIIPDILNALQGLLIFLVIISNPKVIELLKKKLNCRESAVPEVVRFANNSSDTSQVELSKQSQNERSPANKS